MRIIFVSCRTLQETQSTNWTALGIPPAEQVCDDIHHSWDTCGRGKTFTDPGQWSLGQRELPVCLCTSTRRCCQRIRQHVDSSAGPFPSDLLCTKYDMLLTSGGASVQRERERETESLQGYVFQRYCVSAVKVNGVMSVMK